MMEVQENCRDAGLDVTQAAELEQWLPFWLF